MSGDIICSKMFQRVGTLRTEDAVGRRRDRKWFFQFRMKSACAWRFLPNSRTRPEEIWRCLENVSKLVVKWMASSRSSNNVMYWTEQHNIILCREVVFQNPYVYKKGTPQCSETWKKIVDVLNKCDSPQFNVDHRAIRDHINVLVNKYKKKIRAEERASGISPDEPSE